MLLLEMDVLAIIGLWIAVPFLTLRLVHVFRAAVPRWVLRASVAMQWAVVVVPIICVLILALRLFAIVADNVANGQDEQDHRQIAVTTVMAHQMHCTLLTPAATTSAPLR